MARFNIEDDFEYNHSVYHPEEHYTRTKYRKNPLSGLSSLFSFASSNIVIVVFGIIWAMILFNLSAVLDFFAYLTIQLLSSIVAVLIFVLIIWSIWRMLFGRRRRW